MQDEHFGLALSLLGHCYRAREQLVDALRAAARARIEARRQGAHSFETEVSRSTVEIHADEALFTVYRHGLKGPEHDIQFAVDEIVREEMNRARKLPRDRRFL
jgi:hypothetical protein